MLTLLCTIIYVAMVSSKILVDYQEALVNKAHYCECILINVQVYQMCLSLFMHTIVCMEIYIYVVLTHLLIICCIFGLDKYSCGFVHTLQNLTCNTLRFSTCTYYVCLSCNWFVLYKAGSLSQYLHNFYLHTYVHVMVITWA